MKKIVLTLLLVLGLVLSGLAVTSEAAKPHKKKFINLCFTSPNVSRGGFYTSPTQHSVSVKATGLV